MTEEPIKNKEEEKEDESGVVLSGIRATGGLHLGNYLGAMRHFVDLSRDPKKECFFFIANLHTLTTRIEANLIRHDLAEIVLDYLAAGIDPNHSVIFAQSSVPETSELNWLFTCMTPIASLVNLPHFREKRGKMESLGQSVNSGLLIYPVLMAADILGPKANLVPVGEDQKAHVELAREIAKRFNNLYGETFPEPKTLKGKEIRVPGLDGNGKMGKSDGNTINLSDTPDEIRKKIRAAMTDPARVKKTDPGTPAICNIFSFHQIISASNQIEQIKSGCQMAQIGCMECKRILGDNIIDLLTPLQQRRSELEKAGSSFILDILNDGGKRARNIIAPTVADVKEKMGVPLY